MKSRIDIEKEEFEYLSEFAQKSAETKGRMSLETEDDMRTCYQRDRDRILHSKAFRRMMHKTQVFLAPEGDHFRTRLTHTLEVTQISRTIARALGLNEDLTEAIALGHDLGHTPFGHIGETCLDRIYPGGFRHNEQSLRVVDKLERTSRGKTLNLTFEVRDGIINHSGKGVPATLEGAVVKLSDRIAYVNHDLDDAVRAGIIKLSSVPRKYIDTMGETHGDRIDYLVKDVIKNSDGKNEIMQSPEAAEMLKGLRSWLFDNVYKNELVRGIEEKKIAFMINTFYDYFIKHPDQLPTEDRICAKEDGIETAVKDYIAGMTDRYALNLFNDIFVPNSWTIQK